MKRPTHGHAHFSFPNILNPRLTPVFLVVLLALVIQACSSTAVSEGSKPGNPLGTAVTPSDSSGSSQMDELDQAMTLDQVLSMTLEDDRPQVLRQMGPPDVFKITFQELNGTRVRQEEWSYFDDQTRFDFINGALLWTIDINSVSDPAVNASTYNPLNFNDGMTVEEVRTLLNDQQLMQVDLADYGVPDGQALAGDQILLGFEGGKLVSVRTFELVQGVMQ
jgi:hypothetical protein